MNNIISNYNQILDFAKSQGVPANKERGIIREFLQSKFIFHLYALKNSAQLSFIGGTSLRLLRNLNRFSEDLDFDNLGLPDAKVEELISGVANSFRKENIDVELIIKEKDRYQFELRYPNLLLDLKISTDPREKLMIKVDYANLWKKQKKEVLLFNRYGFIGNVITNPLNQLLVQKIAAYVGRKQTQARDMHDIVWLYSQGASFDLKFAKDNSCDDLISKAIRKFETERSNLNNLKIKLRPFLFNEQEINKLDLLDKILMQIKKV